jgi:geranylgeranyl diphosphate synthase, type I
MTALPSLDPEITEQHFIEHALQPYLVDLLDAERVAWKQDGAPWDDPIGALEGFLSGGKALRPRFCFWGYRLGGGAGGGRRIVEAAAALELLHAFALIHDDLMDGSETRRGRPALHRCLADQHRHRGWAGDAEQYGHAMALLTGDLAFALANRLAAALPATAQRAWHRLVAELTCGQHLDLAAAARRDRSPALAGVVARLKSGRYTVTGPLQIGAATASDVALPDDVIRFGDLVGEAFQWRDDLLGVFGDPSVTGKPVGDDLRSGKPTLLLAVAWHRASTAERSVLERAGQLDLEPGDIHELRALIEQCGARRWLERRIEENLGEALGLLRSSGVVAAAAEALPALASAAVRGL